MISSLVEMFPKNGKDWWPFCHRVWHLRSFSLWAACPRSWSHGECQGGQRHWLKQHNCPSWWEFPSSCITSIHFLELRIILEFLSGSGSLVFCLWHRHPRKVFWKNKVLLHEILHCLAYALNTKWTKPRSKLCRNLANTGIRRKGSICLPASKPDKTHTWVCS